MTSKPTHLYMCTVRIYVIYIISLYKESITVHVKIKGHTYYHQANDQLECSAIGLHCTRDIIFGS